MASEESIRRDLAGVGPDPRMAGKLYRMSEIKGYRIAEGEPDIRGWEVRTLAGADVGDVKELLVDPHRGEVVMINVDMRDSDQHINLPLRGVQLDRSRNCVIVDSGDVRTAQESFMAAAQDGDRRADQRFTDERAEDDRAVDDTARDFRYGAMRDADGTTEEVIESRPMIEEVVVRRRPADEEK